MEYSYLLNGGIAIIKSIMRRIKFKRYILLNNTKLITGLYKLLSYQNSKSAPCMLHVMGKQAVKLTKVRYTLCMIFRFCHFKRC